MSLLCTSRVKFEKSIFFYSIFPLLGFFGKRTSTLLTCLLQSFYRDVF